jgi:phosphoserine aminotransferase
MFLSKPCNVSDYGIIYGGVQKNIGPAGLAIVIIREDLIREDVDPKIPTYCRFDTYSKNGSMYNTPNCWAIYVCGKVFKYLKSIGGLSAMAKINEEKAKIIYDFLDQSKMFNGTVEKQCRSLMNVPFVTESAEKDAEVVAATKAAGFDNLKGHKSVGGLRASIYNAMPKEGVQALVDFLKDYEAKNS